jgi:YD repeat-containing protein
LKEANYASIAKHSAHRLLNDGVNTYTYDSANRLISFTNATTTVTYRYNGLNDRLQETVNGITTTFTMDLNTGLTQALSDGTNHYIYGLGRIAQVNSNVSRVGQYSVTLSIGKADMSKPFFHLVAKALLVFLLMLSGCNNSSQVNQSVVPTLTLSLLLPSKTSSPTAQTFVQDTATIGPDTPMPIRLCDKVPELELSKPNDSSNNVYLSGMFYLCWYTASSFDMDSGIFGHTDAFRQIDTTLTDVELKVTKSSFDNSINYFILGANGAYITKSDIESPTIDYCQEKTSDPTLGGGIILGETGMIGCVLTNEGRLGYIKIESIDPFGAQSVEISFITWNKK